MKFTPQSEADVRDSQSRFEPWKPGTYDFEITDAIERMSKNNNEMIALTLFVFNSEGSRRTVFDYLVETVPHKLRHAAEACGLSARYESGVLFSEDFVGKSGRLMLGIQPAKDGFPAKNFVKDYLVRRPDDAQYKGSPSEKSASVVDDEIPF